VADDPGKIMAALLQSYATPKAIFKTSHQNNQPTSNIQHPTSNIHISIQPQSRSNNSKTIPRHQKQQLVKLSSTILKSKPTNHNISPINN
jgi:hypothetical protein